MKLRHHVSSWLTGIQESAQKSDYTALLNHLRPQNKRLRQLALSTTLSVMLAACGQDDAPTSHNTQSDHASRALTYIDAGQYRAAHIELRKASDVDALTVAERSELAYAKAHWFASLGQHKGVITTITQIPIENRTPDMQLALLEAYLASGKLLSAEGLLTQDNGPQLPEHNVQFAKARIALGRRKAQEALKIFTELSKHLPESQRETGSEITAAGNNTAPNTAPNTADSTTETQTAQAPLSDLYVRTQLGIASSHLALRNGVGAEQVIDRLLERQNNLVPALLAKANIAVLRGQFDVAEDALSTALIALPDTDLMEPAKLNVLRSFVAILTRQGRTAEALTYSKILAEQNPQVSELKDQLVAALALWREGKLNDAQEALLELYKQAPNDRIGSLVGLISFLNGDQETANTYFDRHLDAETANANMLLAMSRVFVQEGRMSETLDLVELAHRNNPKDGRITALLGALRLSDGNVAGFAMMEEGLRQAPKQRQMWLALAQARQRLQQDHKKAITTLETARTHYPDDPRLRGALVAALQQDKQLPRAERLVNKWLKDEGETVDNLLLAANVALIKKNAKRAESFLEKARTQAPNNENVLSGLTLAALTLADFERAKSIASELIALKPNSPASYVFFGQAIGRLEVDREKIAQSLTEIVEKHDQPGGFVALYDYHMAGDELEPAEVALQRARDLDPGFEGLNDRDARLAYRLGRQAISERAFADAREHLIRALRYKPNNQTINTLLIRLELQMGNVREAEKLILQLPEAGMDEQLKAQLNGELALTRGDYATAETLLLEAWNKKPLDGIGQALYKTYLSQSKPVLTFLTQWQAKTKSKTATLHLANELSRAGNYKAAIAEYEKISDIIQNNAMALNNLAWSYQQIGDKRARKTAKRASEIAPDEAAILDTYGYILLQVGEKEEAKSILEKAHKLAPDNAEIKAHWEQASR